MPVNLPVHPQRAVGQPALAARALKRLGPVDDPGEGDVVVLDPLAKV